MYVHEIIKVFCGNFHAFQRVLSANRQLRSEPTEIGIKFAFAKNFYTSFCIYIILIYICNVQMVCFYEIIQK